MISILIPTYDYNVVPLVKALLGQRNLSEIEFEIKVYEDGSPSPPKENDALNDFLNTEYKKLENNIGRTAIRHLMAEEAKYDWILFLDADVFPHTIDFLENYIKTIKEKDGEVIFGGIIYDDVKPEQQKLLRWEYGRSREAKSMELRKKEPYFIISQNLCLKKEVFLKANIELENHYGLDNLFSNQLKRMRAKVLHIDNPVMHMGLENNDVFLKKALKAVETTVIMEKKGLMDRDMRPIQKSYRQLKRMQIHLIFYAVISIFKGMMERNFNSKEPNLLWFDLYRLNHYIKYKRKHG